MLLMDVIGVQFKDSTNHTGQNTLGGKIHSFLMLEQMVQVVATGREKVKRVCCMRFHKRKTVSVASDRIKHAMKQKESESRLATFDPCCCSKDSRHVHTCSG